MTGALLEPNATARNYADITQSVDSVVGPFVQTGADDGKRRRNLELIFSRAEKLAFLLFSQPGSFRFDFTGGRQGSVVIFPSLMQVTGDGGQVLSPPRPLSDKEVTNTQ
jgi:hypothetical protein